MELKRVQDYSLPLVGKGREGWFLLLFVLQFRVFTGILANYENAVNQKDALSTFVSVLGGMPGVIELSTASSIVFSGGTGDVVREVFEEKV